MDKQTLREKFMLAAGRQSMIPVGSKILCAVSGGADSVALLRLLASCREELQIAELTACHVNHCLRGEESDRDEYHVRALCLAWDIPLQVFREDAAAYARSLGLSTEEGARKLRYSLFERACPEGGLIATAHTLSDSIETFILNLTRGTGIDGLTGIPPVRGRIIRPLTACTRAEVEAFCREEGLDYVTDSTNLGDDYTRNRIRHHITPQLALINPDYEGSVARSIELLRQDAELLRSLTAEALAAAWVGEGYAMEALRAAKGLLPRVLLAMARERGLAPDYARIQLCCRCVAEGSGAVALGDGYSFYCHGDRAYMTADAKPHDHEAITLRLAELEQVPITVTAGHFKFTLTLLNCEQTLTDENFLQKDLKNLLDYDKMGDILVLRPYKTADKLRQPGRGLTKQVKKLVSEARVPPHRRSDVWVMLSGDRLCWVQGFGQDEWATPDAQTRRYMLIEQAPADS